MGNAWHRVWSIVSALGTLATIIHVFILQMFTEQVLGAGTVPGSGR